MARILILDSGPLGLFSGNPQKPRVARMQSWLNAFEARGFDIVIPEIADYEIRRELLRLEGIAGLHRLDSLHEEYEYLPITTIAMNMASVFWAQVRRKGVPTASPESLDGDCILAGQAVTFALPQDHLTIVTTNIRHLSRFSGFELEVCPI